MRTLSAFTVSFLLVCVPSIAAAQAGFSVDLLTGRPVLPGASPPDEWNATGRASLVRRDAQPARKRNGAKHAATRKRGQQGVSAPDHGRGPGFKIYSPSQYDSPGPWYRQM